MQQLGLEAYAVVALTGEARVDHAHLEVGKLVLQGGDGFREGVVLGEAGHGGELDAYRFDAVDGLAGRVEAHAVAAGGSRIDIWGAPGAGRPSRRN